MYSNPKVKSTTWYSFFCLFYFMHFPPLSQPSTLSRQPAILCNVRGRSADYSGRNTNAIKCFILKHWATWWGYNQVRMQPKGKGEKDMNVKHPLTKECLHLKDEASSLEITGALYTPNGINHTHRSCGCCRPIGTTGGGKAEQLVNWQHARIHSLAEAVQWVPGIQHPGECTEVPPSAPPPPSLVPPLHTLNTTWSHQQVT